MRERRAKNTRCHRPREKLPPHTSAHRSFQSYTHTHDSHLSNTLANTKSFYYRTSFLISTMSASIMQASTAAIASRLTGIQASRNVGKKFAPLPVRALRTRSVVKAAANSEVRPRTIQSHDTSNERLLRGLRRGGVAAAPLTNRGLSRFSGNWFSVVRAGVTMRFCQRSMHSRRSTRASATPATQHTDVSLPPPLPLLTVTTGQDARDRRRVVHGAGGRGGGLPPRRPRGRLLRAPHRGEWKKKPKVLKRTSSE
jgi:hypothetical protein